MKNFILFKINRKLAAVLDISLSIFCLVFAFYIDYRIGILFLAHDLMRIFEWVGNVQDMYVFISKRDSEIISRVHKFYVKEGEIK